MCGGGDQLYTIAIILNVPFPVTMVAETIIALHIFRIVFSINRQCQLFKRLQLPQCALPLAVDVKSLVALYISIENFQSLVLLIVAFITGIDVYGQQAESIIT